MSRDPPASRHIVVIGAGIVGASCVLELLRDGHRVTLLDPGAPGGRQASSYGNGAWISPASCVPIAMPGLWRKIPGYLLDRTGPFTIRPAAIPALLPWLLRFVWSGASRSRVERTARTLAALLADAPRRHAELAHEAGVPDLIRQSGLLYVYPGRAAFEAEALAWELRRQNGIVWEELDASALAEREPDLAAHYGFGVLVPAGAHCRDTGAYVAALVRHAVSLGATIEPRAATGFSVEGERLRAVRTDGGEIACDGAVIAAGIGAKRLAREAGDAVSLVSERGYHVTLPGQGAGPRTPLMPSDGKMANTPTLAGLRAAGQVELAGVDAVPDWRRADILLAHLLTTFPALASAVLPREIDRWMGHRPSTPDGVPVIGPSRATSDILHAFGHGHIGFATGPITGRAVADLLAKRPSGLPLDALSPRRFLWGM